MVVQRMNSGKSYERKVQEPGEIDDLVGELHRRTDENGLTRLFLDHEEEKNIVRGRNQRLRHEEKPGISEVRRRDGGKIWYHDDTKCFMLGIPDGSDKFRKIYMEQWGRLLIGELQELGYDAFMADSDIYDAETGQQLIGMSGSNNKNSSVLRACWYEEEPEINELLEADGKNPEKFHEKYETVKGLYDRLRDHLEPESAGEDFISEEILEEENDYSSSTKNWIEGTCIEKYPVKHTS